MFTDVKRYSFINAKLRARISAILPEKFFTDMAGCPSLTEMFNLLRSTPFSGIADIYEQTGDLKMVELELLKREIALYTDLVPHLPHEATALVRAYMTGYEIENLKNALGIFFDHVVCKRPPDDAVHYLLRDKIINDLPYDALINATSIGELPVIFERTPYGATVAEHRAEIEQKASLFPLLAALDRLYYRYLIEEARRLPPADRRIALRLVGIEIDLLNVNWIMRFKTYYNLPYSAISGLIIPGGQSVVGETLRKVFESQQLSAPLTTMLNRSYPQIAALMATQPQEHGERLAFVERLLEKIMIEEISRLMRGYPFTVGIILAYFMAKRLEIKRIRTVLNAGLLAVTPQQAATLL